MGNARVGEAVVHEASWGEKNKYLGIIGVLSCAGPIMAYNGLYADNTAVSFSGGNATGYYANFMYLDTQLGARPEAAALDMSIGGGIPDWDANSKLSSLATAGIVLVADIDDGKVYSGGVPKLTHQVQGVLTYDSRLDSTNGGAGTQRPGGIAQVETNYAYSENPWVHAGTYALGRWVNGVKVIGPGLPATSIDWGTFAEAANVADANAWKVSGSINSTDSKWEVLKAIAQAGGGYPVPTAGKLAALVNAPRVSLETIEEVHLKGPASVPQVSMRRNRLNGGIPRYRTAANAWEVGSGGVVRNPDYLAADGGATRTKEIDLPLVADTGDGLGDDQAAQLAAYEVANSRERSPITLELDLVWSQYKVGDCLTLNLPSALLANQKCVIIGRELDAAKNTVTLDFRTEDDAKHTWALSVTGSPPPVTTVGSDPGAGDSGPVLTTADITALIRNSGTANLRFSISSTGDITISAHQRVYSDETVNVNGTAGTAADGTGGTPLATGAAVGKYVIVYYDQSDRSGGAVTYQWLIIDAGGDDSSSFASAAHPYRHFVLVAKVPASGSTGGGSSPGTGGGSTGGGGYPTPEP
jgi:hypothetical protein